MKPNFSNIPILDNISLGGFRVDNRSIEAKFLRERYLILIHPDTIQAMINLNICITLAGLRFKDLDLFHTININ
jgi:hypothetical protein